MKKQNLFLMYGLCSFGWTVGIAVGAPSVKLSDVPLSYAFGIGSGLSTFETLNANRGQSLETTLRVLAREGRIKAVRPLLDQGVDPNAMGEFGETALSSAARMGHDHVVKLLIEKGADPELSDYRGVTPLMNAAKNCSIASAEWIINSLRKGAISQVSSDRQSALYFAVEAACPVIVKMLLGTGEFRTTDADHSGYSLVEVARDWANLDLDGPAAQVYELLRKQEVQEQGGSQVSSSKKKKRQPDPQPSESPVPVIP
jgi:hypothetical protein